ncbi:MAG TPA: hypothetical protein VL860_03290 [Planctomycetota bacterium]|jgi:hypothetical protein|nr:hypothetical protein [Planctomycetota bacterium]
MATPAETIELKLLDATDCFYTLCVPARMVEADPRLATVAEQLRGILQSATRGVVQVTPERVIRSLFLLIDLDRTGPTHPPAWALQVQGVDILISGKDAACVALAAARLLTEAGFRIFDGRACLDRDASPAAADGVVIWHGRDQVDLAPQADPVWLQLLLPDR